MENGLIRALKDGKITPSEFEEMLGATENSSPREYYQNEEPDYEDSHRRADESMAWIKRYLAPLL